MTRRIVAIAVCFSMVLYTSTRYLATHVLADDNSSRIFYPAFGHDLRETVPHVPVPALETVAIARVVGDFHGVTIINNNVAEELTEDSTITRGSEIVTGTETSVVFHIGGSRTLILDRSSRIRFNVLNWFDGDLLVQVEHLEGILINDVAGQLTGSSVHETVILDEDGEQFEVGVLSASYLTYINPSNITPEEADQNLAEFYEAYGEELNMSINSGDGALVFFFEGAGTVRRGDQLVEIVLGEGALLSDGEVNVTRFPLERISSLPQLAQNFKDDKRIDAEMLAEIDHRADPVIRERLELLHLHVFASDKPFFEDLSFYDFPVLLEPEPEELLSDERRHGQDDSESHVDDDLYSIMPNGDDVRNELPVLYDFSGSNRITDILFEWSARGEPPEVTEPHEETAILLREDEPGEPEAPENDDDDDDSGADGFVDSFNLNANLHAHNDYVEAESPNYANYIEVDVEDHGIELNGFSEIEDGNSNGDVNNGLGSIYPQYNSENGSNSTSTSETGNDSAEPEIHSSGYDNDRPDVFESDRSSNSNTDDTTENNDNKGSGNVYIGGFRDDTGNLHGGSDTYTHNGGYSNTDHDGGNYNGFTGNNDVGSEDSSDTGYYETSGSNIGSGDYGNSESTDSGYDSSEDNGNADYYDSSGSNIGSGDNGHVESTDNDDDGSEDKSDDDYYKLTGINTSPGANGNSESGSGNVGPEDDSDADYYEPSDSNIGTGDNNNTGNEPTGSNTDSEDDSSAGYYESTGSNVGPEDNSDADYYEPSGSNIGHGNVGPEDNSDAGYYESTGNSIGPEDNSDAGYYESTDSNVGPEDNSDDSYYESSGSNIGPIDNISDGYYESSGSNIAPTDNGNADYYESTGSNADPVDNSDAGYYGSTGIGNDGYDTIDSIVGSEDNSNTSYYDSAGNIGPDDNIDAGYNESTDSNVGPTDNSSDGYNEPTGNNNIDPNNDHSDGYFGSSGSSSTDYLTTPDSFMRP